MLPGEGKENTLRTMTDSPVVNVHTARKHSTDSLGGLESLNPKFRAGILGATGSVGQRFLSLLSGHPWIEIVALAASEKSAGQKYKDACTWRVESPCPSECLEMEVWDAVKDIRKVIEHCDIVFSALATQLAKGIETELAAAGLAVFSNASAHRYDADVPIVIPQVNPEHLQLVKGQKTYREGGGFICTNANCAATGLCVALKPIIKRFGIEAVLMTTLQAVSGAGYPGLSWWDIQNNVIPDISGEEGKLESEPKKILGQLVTSTNSPSLIEPAVIKLSAMVHRVPVLDGHTVSMSLKLARTPEGDIAQEIEQAYKDYCAEVPTEIANLPSMPRQIVKVMHKDDEPQPRLHVREGKGMTVSVGKVRACNVLDVKLTCLSHNTVIGAAGGSVANAELAIATGILR